MGQQIATPVAPVHLSHPPWHPMYCSFVDVTTQTQKRYTTSLYAAAKAVLSKKVEEQGNQQQGLGV